MVSVANGQTGPETVRELRDLGVRAGFLMATAAGGGAASTAVAAGRATGVGEGAASAAALIGEWNTALTMG